MTIKIIDVDGSDGIFANIVETLIDATAAKLGYPFDPVPFQIKAVNADGSLAGGLVAYTVQKWLFIKLLGVTEAARGGGIGRALLARAEAHARQAGLVGVYLDTFEFQAPRFYQELGYTECGRLPAIGGAPQRIWFAKTLDAPEQ
ncbi:MAG: GNAT family N-acetyltransferase [Hoeflea sp.]|uniref:GNAT family N-acetyltransferase n=1 Tax=Hoeflea sp. TaxID=1940281 RepID=UPI001E17B1DC|nr:GNAT family N-acetyltransferase [Hoeflea sp.]MBU4531068.1 GNAT family N-acetyltransferase [Alphaproteobacteria bacterium]MBU4542843.1 GNAT family N-acetyltransferase [Alphaproteobacteria bacterium]MBU4552655.1 GNAT family N-acetyltransferase [Alphaproteobacteria bacterium]MBV1722960.1 GNAT family N-acetyltransferase [Hoeflea sp.]MBV1762871.1 GNAT family N-acetyltransferase [Hoeflea sp.]